MAAPGRTEAQVGADIADAIRAAGHAVVDFVIVASGPNGASPHHATADRVIAEGDAVVVDIGGTMPSGYCSDATRTYVVGEASPAFAAAYAVLREAQRAAVAAVAPGVACRGRRRRRPRDHRRRRPRPALHPPAPATGSASTATRTPTSSPATPFRWSPGWRSR